MLRHRMWWSCTHQLQFDVFIYLFLTCRIYGQANVNCCWGLRPEKWMSSLCLVALYVVSLRPAFSYASSACYGWKKIGMSRIFSPYIFYVHKSSCHTIVQVNHTVIKCLTFALVVWANATKEYNNIVFFCRGYVLPIRM